MEMNRHSQCIEYTKFSYVPNSKTPVQIALSPMWL